MITLEDRAAIAITEAWKLLPDIKYDAWITQIVLADIGAKHGSYSPNDGIITLSERLFSGTDAWELMYIDQHGNTPPIDALYCSRAIHTIIHECFHAIGYTTGIDRSQEWLSLSGWQETWEDRHTTGRYFERRPGWGDQGGSEWVYRKGSWFPREYSSKSPYECLADTGTHIALGWHQNIQHPNGRAKMKYLLRHAWGQTELDRLDAVTAQWRHRLRDYL